MVKLPKQLKVGGHVYEVKYPHRFTERTDRLGQQDRLQLRLFVGDCDANGQIMADTRIYAIFIHEIYHAIDSAICWHLFDGRDGEDKIGALTEATLQLLIDNKEALIEMLKEL